MLVLLRLAFDKVGLHRVQLQVFDFNERAISCYEKCGFRREGMLRDYWFKNGKFRDTLLMSILESEYRNGKVDATPPKPVVPEEIYDRRRRYQSSRSSSSNGSDS